MPDTYCEVIGCKAYANWLLAHRTSPYCENFLCDSCWHILNRHQPDKAGNYINLEALYTLIEDRLLSSRQPDSDRLAKQADKHCAASCA